MSTITADSMLKQALSQLKGVTEIRDADGELLGTFTPKETDVERLKGAFDLKKARMKLATEPTRPFREMVDRLEGLAEKRP